MKGKGMAKRRSGESKASGRKTTWSAGVPRAQRNYFGRNVSQPTIRTFRRSRSSQNHREKERVSTYAFSSAKARQEAEEPQYSLKYLGISNNELNSFAKTNDFAHAIAAAEANSTLETAAVQVRSTHTASRAGSPQRPSTPSSHWSDNGREGGARESAKPQPELYDTWLIQSIPPRPALSAGRKRIDEPIRFEQNAVSGALMHQLVHLHAADMGEAFRRKSPQTSSMPAAPDPPAAHCRSQHLAAHTYLQGWRACRGAAILCS